VKLLVMLVVRTLSVPVRGVSRCAALRYGHMRLPCRSRGWLGWEPRAGCGAGQRKRAGRELAPSCRV
jgi:hypothetical protein